MNGRLHELEAYEIMQQTQEKLHSKYMMSATLEECFNQNFFENFQKEFISQNTEGKQYYTRILLMSKYFRSTRHPFAEYKKYDSEKSKSPIIEIPARLDPTEVEDFASIFIELNENNALDQKLIDIITYSLIPSFYLMFLEKNSFVKFIEFINELKLNYEQNPQTNPLHYLFSRSLFVSPIFLTFVRKVLHNTLQPLYGSDQSNISISRIKHQIILSFKENIHHIPSYMVHFFSDVKDTINFLDKCLFEPLIENPTLFLIVDFNVVSNKKMTEFKEVLKLVFDEQLKQEISEIVDKNKKSEKAIFVPNHNQAKQISDQTKFKVINSIDQIAIKLILDKLDTISKKDSNDNNNNNDNTNNTNDNKNEDIKLMKNNSDINSQILGINYSIYKALFTKEKVNDLPAFLIQTYMSNESDNWMYLRYILKNAQPLPKKCNLTNDDVVNGQSFADLVKEYVVDTFGPKNIVDAYIALERFRTDLVETPFNSPKEFQKRMENLITNHDEQEKAMEMISRFNKELHYLQDKMKDSILLIKQAFLVYLIDLYEIGKGQDLPEIPKRAIDIISNPHKYIKMYEEYIEKQEINAMNLTGNDCRNILCGHFYQNLDFYSFLSFRTDLNKFDELARQCCQRQLGESFNQTYIQKVYRKVRDMSIFNDSYKELNHAFEINGDPVTKSKAIFDGIIGIFNSIKSSYGGLGADYYVPIRFYIFSLINPPYLISNIVFLYEFLYYKSSEFFENDDFDCYEDAIQNIIDELSIFIKFPILRLARTKRKSCELFITGNDSSMIVDLLNKILTLFKGSIALNEDEKNQVIKEIEANEDKILTFEQGAYKFNKNILFNNFTIDSNMVKFNYYVEIKINIGLKIPLTQIVHNKKYDLRLATYIRNKDRESIFKNKDIKNFVDDDGLNNKMKTILLDQEDPKFKKPNVNVDVFDNFIHKFYNIIDKNWR